VAVVFFASSLLAPSRAFAQAAEPFDLEWDAPAECPSERQVRERIRKLAGSAGSTEAPLQAEARITRGEDSRLHLELVVRAGKLVGTRKIDGRSCDDLAGATAVALALLLRSSTPLREEDLAGNEHGETLPSGGGTTGAPSASGSDANRGSAPSSETSPGAAAAPPASSASSPTTSEPERPPARAPQDETPSTRTWRVLIQAPLVAFAVGTMPEPGVGVAAAAGASFDRWRFLVEGDLWRTQRMTASDEPSVGADVGLISVGPRACWAALQGNFELAPCLVLTVQHLSAEGSGDHIAPRTAEATWLAAGAGARARWRLAAWFALVGRLSAEVETSRPIVAIDGVGTLGQIGPVSLTLALGPEWIF
jgi:hypothetical protein